MGIPEQGPTGIGGGNVYRLELVPRALLDNAGEPLTTAELAEVRAMLAAFRKLIAPSGCPVARSVLLDD